MKIFKFILIVLFTLIATSGYTDSWNTGAWNTGGYWTSGGYSPCPPNSSCVLNSPLIFNQGSYINSTILSTPIPANLGNNAHTGVVQMKGTYLQTESLNYVNSGLYDNGTSTTCGIMEAIAHLRSENMLLFSYIIPESPCIITSPIVLDNATGITIGGNGSMGNNALIITNAPMQAAFIISSYSVTLANISILANASMQSAINISPPSGTNDYVVLNNLQLYDPFQDITGEYISETNNSEGVIKNLKIMSTSNPVYAIYAQGILSNSYINVNEDTSLGSFFSSTSGNSGQSIKIDNYVGGAGNVSVYTYGGLEINRMWLGRGSLQITETTSTTPIQAPAIKLDQLGQLGYGLWLYNVWNATISNTNFLYLDAGISFSLDSNCGNDVLIGGGQIMANIVNNSPNPLMIIGAQAAPSIVGAYMQFGGTGGSSYPLESIKTDNGSLTFSTTGVWLTTTSKAFLNNIPIATSMTWTTAYTNGAVTISNAPFPDTNYSCTSSYTGTPSVSIGYPAFTYSTGSVFTDTSRTSTGAMNTTDNNAISISCTKVLP